jgi:hypothetical protein
MKRLPRSLPRGAGQSVGAALPDMQSDDALLDDVQCETFGYFLHEMNERNGLVADCTRPGWPRRSPANANRRGVLILPPAS